MFKHDDKWWITVNDILNEVVKDEKFNLDVSKTRTYIASSLLKQLKDEAMKVMVPQHVAADSKIKSGYLCNTQMLAFELTSVLDHLVHYPNRVTPSYSRYGLSGDDKRYIIQLAIKFCKNKKMFKKQNDDIVIIDPIDKVSKVERMTK